MSKLETATAKVFDRVVMPPQGSISRVEWNVRKHTLENLGEQFRPCDIDGVIPQEPGMHYSLDKLSRVFVPFIKIGGRDNLQAAHNAVREQDKQLLFVASHSNSHASGPALDRALRDAGFKDLAFDSVWIQGIRLDKHDLMRSFMRALPRLQVWPSTVPIKTEADKQKKKEVNMKARETVQKVYDDKRHLVVFPEGERSKLLGGAIQEPKSPIAHLLREDVLVVPVALMDIGKVLGIHKWHPSVAIPTVVFGKPELSSDLRKRYAHLTSSAQASYITHDAMKQVAQITRPELRGFYANRVQ